MTTVPAPGSAGTQILPDGTERVIRFLAIPRSSGGGEVAVVVRGPGHGSAPNAAQIAEFVANALRRLSSVIPIDSETIEVVAEPDRQAFEHAVGSSPATHDWVAATIWTAQVFDRTNPAARVELDHQGLAGLTSLGQRVVLTHELVHVLTAPRAHRPVPLWLREGLADTLAFRGTGLGAVAVTDGVLQGLVVPDTASLPTDADFRAGGRREAVAYAQSWVACQLIAAQVGDQGLARFAALADGSGPTSTLDGRLGVALNGPIWSPQAPPTDAAAFGVSIQDAVSEVLGGSPSGFESAWRNAVRALAAGQTPATLTTGPRAIEAAS